MVGLIGMMKVSLFFQRYNAPENQDVRLRTLRLQSLADDSLKCRKDDDNQQKPSS